MWRGYFFMGRGKIVIWAAFDEDKVFLGNFVCVLVFLFFPCYSIFTACAVATNSLPGRYACERVRHPNRLGLYGPHRSLRNAPRVETDF